MRELGRGNRVSFSTPSSKGVPKIPKSKSEPDPKLDSVIKNLLMNRRKSNEQASQPESTKMKRFRNGGSDLELDLNFSSTGAKPKAQFQDFVSHGDIQKNLWEAEDGHSFGQLDTKSPCSSSDAENFEEDLSDSHTPPKTSPSCRGSFLINASEDREILEILYNVKNSKKIRKQEKLRDQLSNIQRRVKMALENFALVKEEEASSTKLPSVSNNISIEQQKKNDRNNILFTIETYISRSVIHQELLLELELWHKNKENLSEDFGLLSNKDLRDINSSQELHNSILKDLEIMSNTGKRIITLGQQLLDEMRKVKKKVFHLDRQRDPFKKSNREKIIVHNERELHENPTKRNAAVKMVLEQIDESIASMKSKVLKASLGAARKQYQYLMNVADQQNNELKEKGRQYIELKDNIVKAESQCKELQKQLEETRYKDFNIKDGTDNLLLQIEMQNERNRELKAKFAELQITHHETKIKMQEREAPPPSLQTSKPTSIEPDVAPQPPFPQSVLTALQIPEQACSETLLQFLTPEEELTTHKNEASSYQKVITRKNLTSELDKMKSDVLREKMRHEDEMQIVHSGQMSILKEDIHRVLCALVSFKNQLTQVLLKENLQDVAEKFDKLENLAEKISPASTDAIGLVVSSVVDYLHSLLEIISYGFQAYKRLFPTFQASTPLPVKMKHNQEKTKVLVKDITKQKNASHHACPGVQNMMTKMEIIKDTQQKDLREMPDNVSKHDDLTFVELDKNLALIGKAYEENKVSKSLYKKAVMAIQRLKCMPLLKLKTLMEWYIEVKKVEQLRESYINLTEDQNGNDNIVVDLENYMLACQKKQQQKILETQEKWKKIEHEKKELNARMLKIFNKLYDETGILLIYPMLWDTNMQSKIICKSLPSIEQKTLRNMLCNRGRTKSDIFKLPEVVSGVAMPIRRSLTSPQTGTITKHVIKSDNHGEPFLPAVIMTPHLVNYQINRPHLHAIRYWKKHGSRVRQSVSVFKRDCIAFNPNA